MMIRFQVHNIEICFYCLLHSVICLCAQLKSLFPGFRLSLPPKRWFRNNFDKNFLEDRMIGLQAFLDNITGHKDICNRWLILSISLYWSDFSGQKQQGSWDSISVMDVSVSVWDQETIWLWTSFSVTPCIVAILATCIHLLLFMAFSFSINHQRSAANMEIHTHVRIIYIYTSYSLDVEQNVQ